MERHDPGILGKSPDDIINGGLIDTAHCGELIESNTALLTKLPDAADIQIGILHGGLLLLPVFGLV